MKRSWIAGEGELKIKGRDQPTVGVKKVKGLGFYLLRHPRKTMDMEGCDLGQSRDWGTVSNATLSAFLEKEIFDDRCVKVPFPFHLTDFLLERGSGAKELTLPRKK